MLFVLGVWHQHRKYSAYYTSVECCKFLISKGADLDRLDFGKSNSALLILSPWFYMTIIRLEPSFIQYSCTSDAKLFQSYRSANGRPSVRRLVCYLSRKRKCMVGVMGCAEFSRITLPFRNLLLEAGADPTVADLDKEQFDLPTMPLAQALIDSEVSAGSTVCMSIQHRVACADEAERFTSMPSFLNPKCSLTYAILKLMD